MCSSDLIQEQDDNKLSATGTPSQILPGNVYTLYNKDGYVIAAIVLGEDEGTTKNLVYSHKSSIESEKYSVANDEWTWTRKVIFNGEEILLTQTGDKLKDNNIYDMSKNVWYEVNLKADGTVKDVKYAWYTDPNSAEGTIKAASTALTRRVGDDPDTSNGTTQIPGDFVDDIQNLEAALNDNKNDSTTLYEELWDADRNLTKAPSLDGSTLYVDTANKKGFYVNKTNIKSVLIQTNNGDTTTTYYDTIGDLEDILDDLNVKDDKYNFKISAILTDGRATVVIIHDLNKTEGEKGEKPVVTGEYTSAEKATGATPIPEMAMNKAEITDDMKLKVPALYMGKNVRDQLEEILTSMGYKVTKSLFKIFRQKEAGGR